MAASSLRCSNSMEIEYKNPRSSNVPHLNRSEVVESGDEGDVVAGGKGQAKASSVINVNDNSSDEKPAVKESEDAEHGTILSHKSITNIANINSLTKIALQRTGVHQFTHSSTESQQLTMLVTQLDAFTSLSAMQRPVKAKV